LQVIRTSIEKGSQVGYAAESQVCVYTTLEMKNTSFVVLPAIVVVNGIFIFESRYL
jgi:hypothetical protein